MYQDEEKDEIRTPEAESEGLTVELTEEYYIGAFTPVNYLEEFEKGVTLLLLKRGTVPERNQAVEAITEAYIKSIGQIPDGVQLQRLANWILMDFLTDNHPDKVTREEYPIMSKRQLKTRYMRERADEFIEKRSGSLGKEKGKRDLASANSLNN